MEINALGLPSSTQEKSQSNALDKDSFLKIFAAQLQYQNPAEPMDSSNLISQMAQFSMVEQLYNVSRVLEEMVQAQAFSQATSMIGHEVKLITGEGETVSGIVEKVNMQDDSIKVTVNGFIYDFSRVIEVGPAPEPEADTAQGKSTDPETSSDTTISTADVESIS